MIPRFHNLRAGRETELTASYSLHVVCSWIGNSTLVAQKHYLQVTEDDFQRAAKSGAVALQNGVQQAAARVRNNSQASAQPLEECDSTRNDDEKCDSSQDERIRPEGFEPPTLGSEDRCSVQLSYGRASPDDNLSTSASASQRPCLSGRSQGFAPARTLPPPGRARSGARGLSGRRSGYGPLTTGTSPVGSCNRL